jgi:hypothetical protein
VIHLSEISEEKKQEVVELVEKQKKAQLHWIETITGLTKDEIKVVAWERKLIIVNDMILLPSAFKEKQEELDEHVYCQQCGELLENPLSQYCYNCTEKMTADRYKKQSEVENLEEIVPDPLTPKERQELEEKYGKNQTTAFILFIPVVILGIFEFILEIFWELFNVAWIPPDWTWFTILIILAAFGIPAIIFAIRAALFKNRLKQGK